MIKITNEQRVLFAQLMEIADMIYDKVGYNDIDQRTCPPDHECVQTNTTILLESNNILHTPWGRWEIMQDNPTIMFEESEMMLELYRPGYNTPLGYFEPLYEIKSVNGKDIAHISPIDLLDKNKKQLRQMWCRLCPKL